MDLNVDQNPEEARTLGVTVVPSLLLVRDRHTVFRVTGEVGAANIKSWLQTAMENA